jgi:hypothetical protein
LSLLSFIPSLSSWISRCSIVPVMRQATLLNSVPIAAAKTNNKKVRKTISKNNNTN